MTMQRTRGDRSPCARRDRATRLTPRDVSATKEGPRRPTCSSGPACPGSRPRPARRSLRRRLRPSARAPRPTAPCRPSTRSSRSPAGVYRLGEPGEERDVALGAGPDRPLARRQRARPGVRRGDRPRGAPAAARAARRPAARRPPRDRGHVRRGARVLRVGRRAPADRRRVGGGGPRDRRAAVAVGRHASTPTAAPAPRRRRAGPSRSAPIPRARPRAAPSSWPATCGSGSPTRADEDGWRAVRGGSYLDHAWGVRASRVLAADPARATPTTGFRIAKDPPRPGGRP